MVLATSHYPRFIFAARAPGRPSGWPMGPRGRVPGPPGDVLPGGAPPRSTVAARPAHPAGLSVRGAGCRQAEPRPKRAREICFVERAKPERGPPARSCCPVQNLARFGGPVRNIFVDLAVRPSRRAPERHGARTAGPSPSTWMDAPMDPVCPARRASAASPPVTPQSKSLSTHRPGRRGGAGGAPGGGGERSRGGPTSQGARSPPQKTFPRTK